MSIGLKVFIGAIIVGLLGWACYDWKTTHEQVGELKEKVAAQAKAIEGWEKAEELRKAAGKIDATAGVNAEIGRQGVVAHQGVIKETVDAKVSAIRDKYRVPNPPAGITLVDPPKTDQNCLTALPSMEEIEVAEARIEGVWSAYCHAEPDAQSCKPNTPKVANQEKERT